jgi:hypothetical protein
MASDTMVASRILKSDLSLALKVFAGEVLTAFEEKNILMDKHNVRTVKDTNTAQFPAIGGTTAKYHTIGVELLGTAITSAEKTISIDGLLLSDCFIADIDEAMSHFEVRSRYSSEMGYALANAADRNIAYELVKAARATTTIPGGYGGTEISNDKFKIAAGAGAADVTEQAKALAAGLFAAAQSMDEKDVPETRYAMFRPQEYYALAQNVDLINKLYGGLGAYSEGSIVKVAGITILKSNHLPKLNGTKATYDPAGGTTYVANKEYSQYHGADCSKTIGIVWCPEAVGTVKLMDLQMQSDYLVQRQGTLLVARYAMGHGVLRPECAVELKLNTLSNTVSTYPS